MSNDQLCKKTTLLDILKVVSLTEKDLLKILNDLHLEYGGTLTNDQYVDTLQDVLQLYLEQKNFSSLQGKPINENIMKKYKGCLLVVYQFTFINL